MKLVREGKRLTIYGDGEASRGFIYVSGTVSANLLAYEVGGAGEVYNIACGGRVTINRLVEKLVDILGEKTKPIYSEPRPGDVKHSYASIEKARSDLGYEVDKDFEKGISALVEIYVKFSGI